MTLPDYKAKADEILEIYGCWGEVKEILSKDVSVAWQKLTEACEPSRVVELARFVQCYPHLPDCNETGCVPDCAASGSCCNELANRLGEELDSLRQAEKAYTDEIARLKKESALHQRLACDRSMEIERLREEADNCRATSQRYLGELKTAQDRLATELHRVNRLQEHLDALAKSEE